MGTLVPQALSVPVWVVKTFGAHGPQYEVTGYAGQSAAGEELVEICVVRTGEILPYEYSEMMLDPEAI